MKLNNTKTDIAELKAWRDAIESRIISFDRCAELAPVRNMLARHNAAHPKESILASITRDGNYDDDSVEWAISHILSGDWIKVYGDVCTGKEAQQQLKLAQKLKELAPFEREMVVRGTTINEDVYNFLMSGDPSGII